jgi:RNA polymerase sigma factor (sigma-70 family)
VEIAPAAVRHINLVRKIVNRHFFSLTQHGYDLDDLVQEGLYAIMKAEPQYDPSRGAESTYYYRAAYNWISWRVGMYIKRKRRSAHFEAYSLEKEIPNAALAERSSEFGPTGLNQYGSLADGRYSEDAIIDNIVLRQMLARLSDQSPKQATAVRLYYLRGMIDSEVAAAMRCSRQNASYLIQRGLRNLRAYYKQQEEETA